MQSVKFLVVVSGVLSLVAARSDGGVAQSGIANAGQPDTDRAAGANFTTLNIQTFSGVSGIAGSQNLVQNVIPVGGSVIYQPDKFTVNPGVLRFNIPFGTAANAADQVYETWDGLLASIDIPKPANAVFVLTTQDPGGGKAFTDFASGYYFPGGAPLAPGKRIAAKVEVTAAAPAGTRSGARVVDPYPIVAAAGSNTYAYTAKIGGPDATGTDPTGAYTYTPTMLSVDAAGETSTMEYFADDSNDPTFKTTQSNPIWDFSVSLNTRNGAPVLSADFSYDPSRLSILTGGSTSTQLLANLLADTTDVSYSVTGPESATFSINNPFDLFGGTYTANLTPASVDPNLSSDIDFTFGTASATVPEPASIGLAVVGVASVLARPRRKNVTAL